MRPTLRKDAAGYAKKDAPLRRTLPFTSNEPRYGHFELLMAVEEGARPVIIPIANPPTAPARIPIRTRNFAFSRMRVLCLTGGPPNYASAQILSQFVRRKSYKRTKSSNLCVVELHIVMQCVSSGARSRLEVSRKPMILQAWTFSRWVTAWHRDCSHSPCPPSRRPPPSLSPCPFPDDSG
jgi:hypothetical protein